MEQYSPQRPAEAAAHEPRWRPLSSLERRVAGVLIEKAKTTPDIYPMTINALVAGCNQKSNRHPLMNVEAEDVEAALDKLRAVGAAAVVQGSGRVSKYRHYLYEWLGVDKVEMAVMTELLLRGAQSEGDLRGRAARMEPIADLSTLRPVLDSLKTKKLIVPLTPEGRGHMLTHALYEPRELEKLRAQFAAGAPPADEDESPRQPAEPARSEMPTRSEPPTHAAAPAAAYGGAAPSGGGAARDDASSALRGEINELRNQVAQLRAELEELAIEVRQGRDEIDRLKEALGA